MLIKERAVELDDKGYVAFITLPNGDAIGVYPDGTVEGNVYCRDGQATEGDATEETPEVRCAQSDKMSTVESLLGEEMMHLL